MNSSCNFFLSEKIALAACRAINKNPEVPLEKENLVKLQHGNISKENAQKNINTLKKLGILDETGLPTDLGRNWANEITRKDATAIIVQTSFPSGTIQASSLPSNDFVAWIAKNANTTKSVVEKSVTTFRILMRICEPETPKKESCRHRSPQKKSTFSEMSDQCVMRVPITANEEQIRTIAKTALELNIPVEFF